MIPNYDLDDKIKNSWILYQYGIILGLYLSPFIFTVFVYCIYIHAIYIAINIMCLYALVAILLYFIRDYLCANGAIIDLGFDYGYEIKKKITFFVACLPVQHSHQYDIGNLITDVYNYINKYYNYVLDKDMCNEEEAYSVAHAAFVEIIWKVTNLYKINIQDIGIDKKIIEQYGAYSYKENPTCIYNTSFHIKKENTNEL